MRRALVLLVLTAAHLPASAASAQEPRVVTWEVPSRFVDLAEFDLGGSPPHRPKPAGLRVNVYLPEGYDGKREFPVLYLLHGHGEDYADWADPGKGDVLATAAGFPGIIVMPEGWRGWYMNWWNGGRRGAPAWERYHLDEVIPLVEERLRVRPGRRWRAIAGWSMGGAGAIYYASQRPGYFGSAATFSGTLSLERPDWGPAFETQGEDFEQVYGDRHFYLRGHNPTALTANLEHTRLYATTGNGLPEPGDETTFALDEFYVLQHNNDFFLAAQLAGLDLTYRPRDGRHEFRYWRQHFRDAVAWGFFEPVDERPGSWTLQTVAQHGEMWCLRYAFEQPPDVLETFEMSGGILRGEGEGTVTITTRDGRSLTARLPFEREAPSDPCAPARASGDAPKLRLRVRPRRVRAGERSRLRLRTVYRKAGRPRPVAGAAIRVAGREVTTGRSGRARATVRFQRPRVVRLRASRRGFRPDTARLRVVR